MIFFLIFVFISFPFPPFSFLLLQFLFLLPVFCQGLCWNWKGFAHGGIIDGQGFMGGWDWADLFDKKCIFCFTWENIHFLRRQSPSNLQTGAGWCRKAQFSKVHFPRLFQLWQYLACSWLPPAPSPDGGSELGRFSDLLRCVLLLPCSNRSWFLLLNSATFAGDVRLKPWFLVSRNHSS